MRLNADIKPYHAFNAIEKAEVRVIQADGVQAEADPAGAAEALRRFNGMPIRLESTMNYAIYQMNFTQKKE